jgi:hypothetical protein
MWSGIRQSQRDQYCMVPQEGLRGVQFTETESRLGVARGWRKGNTELLVDTESQFCKMSRVLLDRWW